MKTEKINRTVDTAILPYDTYKNAGYTDSDIQEFMRPRLENVGYTSEQINNYFYKQGVDAATVQQVSNKGKSQVDELGKYVAEISAMNESKETNLGFTDAIKIGLQAVLLDKHKDISTLLKELEIY